jgi:drug/metabolite transporter (DMT)-like permease
VIAGTAVGALLYAETPSAWMALALALLFAGMRLVGRGRLLHATAH